MDDQYAIIKRLLVMLSLMLLATASSSALAISVSRVGVMADIDRSLEGDNKCTTCHAAQMTIYQTKHGVKGDARTPGCQSCHGENAAHRQEPNKNPPEVVFGAQSKRLSPVEKRNEACLSCHESNVLPRPYWSGSQHERRGLACTTCHEVHSPNPKVFNKLAQPEVCFGCHKTQRAQVHRFSRHPILEGKLTCSSCHNPHGSPGPTLLVKNSVNETCYTCHAEKRGPFLWEHAPVVDDCTNCHTPHGSNLTPLLKTRAPMLCQNCHTGDHGKNLYSGANLPGGNVITGGGLIALGSQSPPAQGNSRSCLSCHSIIHGSNHPAGAKFQR
jgi:DmsE family decaheme c-type cytochrome